MNTSAHADLARIGDELEQAISHQIAGTIVVRRRRKLRSRTTVAALVAAGVVALGGTAAVAVSLLSPNTVAKGMPTSTAIFIGTKATCTTKDNVVFDCTLDKKPRQEVSDFTGTKETFNDDKNNVAGGCVGLDVAGLHWTCYAGERAVEEGIIGPGMLGLHSDGPAVG